MSWIEADGAYLRLEAGTETMVSGDGTNLSRRCPDRIDAITPEGVVSRRRDPKRGDT